MPATCTFVIRCEQLTSLEYEYCVMHGVHVVYKLVLLTVLCTVCMQKDTTPFVKDREDTRRERSVAFSDY